MNVSYDIIRQFSKQLYTNPRKAIEELICNSYDAGAKECWVKVPLTGGDSLFVLDNGTSMDFDGLKDLWKVASSPKVKDGGPREANGRRQIGKFGVGKLAAFALGRRLTHIACRGEDVRIVSVSEDEIREQGDGGKPKFAVSLLRLSEAQRVLSPYLKDLPLPWENGWPTWTLAIIGEIQREGIGAALKVGILKNMITAALPISPDFKVYLEKERIETKTSPVQKVELEVPITDPKFRSKVEESLQAYWQKELGESTPDAVPEKYYRVRVGQMTNPKETSESIPALIVPEVGPLGGKAIVTETNLSTPKEAERGYASNGFAIYSSGKLVNPEDELFGVSQRSHKYWRRFRADVEVPGLDDELLVQRNAVSENSPRVQVTRVVMRSLFNYARNKAEELEEASEAPPRAIGTRLRMLSPILIEQAFRGLDKSVLPMKGLERLGIEFVSLGEDSPASRFDVESGKVVINDEHPIFKALDDLTKGAGGTKEMLGDLMVGSEMNWGYLVQAGVDDEVIDAVKELFDVTLRGAASSIRSEVEELIQEIDQASYEGGRPFEDAVVKAFRALKISAKRIGGADEPDGVISLVKAPVGIIRICVEAKGSGGVITHKVLSESTAKRHMRDRGCQHTIAIAREYQEEGIGGKPSGLIREAKGLMPLITTDAISELLRRHEERPFNTASIETILTTWVHPSKQIKFIDEIWKRLPDLGLLKLILDIAEEQIAKQKINYPHPAMILTDRRAIKKGLDMEKVENTLKTIQLVTGEIVFRKDGTFEMLARSETILKEIGMESVKRGAKLKKGSKKSAS